MKQKKEPRLKMKQKKRINEMVVTKDKDIALEDYLEDDEESSEGEE